MQTSPQQTPYEVMSGTGNMGVAVDVLPQYRKRRLKIAIIGAGPGGLAAALEMAKLPFVEWSLYEQKPEISETGGGISLQPNTWTLLEKNGAAKHLHTPEFFRPTNGLIEQRRNGRNGELLYTKYETEVVSPTRQTCRLLRARLQAALLKGVDKSQVHVNMKLVSIEHLPGNQIRISFKNGFVDEVDLLIGADGIRSVVRQFAFPHYKLQYVGQCVYRTIVSKGEVMKIDGFPWTPTFWKHASGLYVFTCPLGNDDFEVTVRIRRQDYNVVSWGRSFDLHALLHYFDDFCLPIQRILRLAADGQTQEFALFSGQRLPRVVSNDNIALIGDASHPMLGNFGAGSGFALEDVYALTKTLDWAWSRGRKLTDALELFDSIRSSHYTRLYGLIDKFKTIKSTLQEEGYTIDQEIEERVKRISIASETWMYHFDINQVVLEAFDKAHRADEAGAVCVKPKEQVLMAKPVGKFDCDNDVDYRKEFISTIKPEKSTEP